MTTTVDKIYKELQNLDIKIKNDFLSKGLVVPVKYKDGSIGVGFYRIKKEKTGFYSITDTRKEILVDNINLPQTAAIIANKLAVGKFIDVNILNMDKKYGYALFDETMHIQLAKKNLKNKNLDNADLFYTKANISKLKKNYYKSEIDFSYRKLIKFR